MCLYNLRYDYFCPSPLDVLPHLIHNPLDVLHQLFNMFHFFETSIKIMGKAYNLIYN